MAHGTFIIISNLFTIQTYEVGSIIVYTQTSALLVCCIENIHKSSLRYYTPMHYRYTSTFTLKRLQKNRGKYWKNMFKCTSYGQPLWTACSAEEICVMYGKLSLHAINSVRVNRNLQSYIFHSHFFSLFPIPELFIKLYHVIINFFQRFCFWQNGGQA